jgi:signal transduction histidine kinase/ActR/RegA family two-component response regulator
LSSENLTDQLRNTLGRLEAALSSVKDALALTNLYGVVEWTNSSFDTLVGRTRLQSLGNYLPDLLPEHYVSGKATRCDQLIAQAANGAGSENWDLSLDPPRRVQEVSWSPVNLLPKPSLVFVFRDLSSIIQAQDEIKRARDNLEQEVFTRTAELQQARDEALAARNAMGRFLSNISHEIRTPMNAVIGMTDLLLTTELNEHQGELVHTIHHSGDLLLKLINDILDLSKIQADHLQLRRHRLEIRALVQECCAILQPSADSKGLRMEIGVDPEVPKLLIGDSLRVRQVLLNLINNAIKFTNHGYVSVQVSSRYLDADSERLEVRVEDSGPGIAAEFLPSLFDAFTQAPSAGEQPQGSGLGLAICNRLCSLMGGRLEVSSQVGVGSRFCAHVTLERFHNEASTDPGTPKASRCPVEAPRILVVEDNRINQRVLELLLGQLELSAEFVNDGEAALERLQHNGIDLVLMDLQMPGIDGLEATRQLRQLNLRQPYLVALTAFAFDQQKLDCQKAGMEDFLSKPVRLSDLQEALDRYHLWLQTNPAPSPQQNVVTAPTVRSPLTSSPAT